MNRNAVKTFAQWGRRQLHDLVRARLALFGVSEKGAETPTRIQGGLIVGGQTLTLSSTDLGQYDALLRHLQTLPGSQKDRYQSLVDEIAYTWFNRLAALRFMEVHGYAERALSSDQPGQPDPNLLRDAVTLAAAGDLGESVTPDAVAEWQRLYQPGEVYRRVLAAYAGTFARSLPFLFGREQAWLDLFLPDTLLNTGSVVRRMVDDIPEDDWQDIEIVGWLYQFYISERKDEVFAQKGKYTPRDIPAATQLFTPHWIVRYMVENSLGRVWLEAHPESGLREHMPYYLESENPAPPANPDLTPESLSVMDPACGSGHILVYAFDLLAHIYRERGYGERDIPALILTHNLHGLDIDERAAQLASFAVVMKARELNSRLLRRELPELNIVQVKSTRGLLSAGGLPNAGARDLLGNYAVLSGGLTDADTFNPNDWQPLVDAFEDADHLGSLITPPAFDAGRLRAQLHWLEERGGLDAGALEELRQLLKQAELLARKYDAVVANPPYMGGGTYTPTLKTWVERFYPRSKADLFAVFMERSLNACKSGGIMGMVNQHSWMFLSSYENLREHLLKNADLQTLLHLGARAFPEIGGEVVQTVAFTVSNAKPNDNEAIYFRLVDYKNTEEKENAVLKNQNCYIRRSQSDFGKIPGSPIGYWLSSQELSIFAKNLGLKETSIGRQGLATTDNDQFIRIWHECNSELFSVFVNIDLGNATWYPAAKGGEFRRWFGNNEYVVDWKNNGVKIKNNINRKYPYLNGNTDFVAKNTKLYFLPGISWSKLTSGSLSVRMINGGYIYTDPGSFLIFKSGKMKLKVLSLLNSAVVNTLLLPLSPTLNYNTGDIDRIPFINVLDFDESLAQMAVDLSKADWDNFETSWDFTTHPLLRPGTATVSEAFSQWQAQSEAAFRELQRLEQENNRYWIDAYGLGDELTPEVPDDQITIRRADLGRDVRSLLSYAVGCMMGRYSLDEPGLIHAGQPFDPSRHSSFPADADGILPVTQDAYFDDDVTTRFKEFLRVAFAPERVAENLEWVAAGLGGQKAGESAEARVRRYFVSEFMSDHIQTYKKRPIYWLFTSGRRRGFGALVYLHRYDEGTLSRLRTDYLLPLQRILDAEQERARGDRDAAGSTNDKKNVDKRLKALADQIVEVHQYDESLKHGADLRIPLDLDDGVAYNYWLMSEGGQAYRTGRALRGLQDLVYSGTDLKMADLQKKSQWKRDLLAEAGAGEGGLGMDAAGQSEAGTAQEATP